ncbi:hypothetical protein [Rhodanobacter ginsengiterrae]|uniref:hypothetical protein n=1 Tax=Rhodanobacter ginsengiterrae TaxID=2008451 RepID=UPI003CECF487
MKPARITAIALAFAIFSGTVAASSGSLNAFPPKVLPVLVQVNAHGKVTDASPALELSPQLRRLLHRNLDEMISAPATDKHGRAISSQFIVNLALQAAPRTNGNYDAHFTFISTAPVPAGSWYWVHIDGHRLALARQGSSVGERRVRYQHERHESPYQHSHERAPTPPVDNTFRSAPAASPARSPAQGR